MELGTARDAPALEAQAGGTAERDPGEQTGSALDGISTSNYEYACIAMQLCCPDALLKKISDPFFFLSDPGFPFGELSERESRSVK
jgi:hypothetical protein